MHLPVFFSLISQNKYSQLDRIQKEYQDNRFHRIQKHAIPVGECEGSFHSREARDGLTDLLKIRIEPMPYVHRERKSPPQYGVEISQNSH